MTPEELREALEAITVTQNIPKLGGDIFAKQELYTYQLEKMLKAAFVLGMQTAAKSVSFNPTIVANIEQTLDRAIS